MTEYLTPTMVGRQWVWPDGTIMPVVSGGADDAPAPTPTATPAAPDAEVPPAVVPYDKYKTEIDNHVKERNLWKPYQKAFSELDQPERDAILALTDAVKAGDTESIVNWSIATAENVSGKSAAELIAARQAASPNKPIDIGTPTTTTVAPTPALAAEDIKRLVAEAVQEDRAATSRETRQREIIAGFTTKLQTAGYEPSTPVGRTIISMCREMDGDMDAAITAFRTDVLAKATQAGVAAAQTAATTPTPSPAGTPSAGQAGNISSRDKVLMRLRQAATQ